ncbi:MAG: IS21 family transposase [Dehalococcoidia bacterium]|nr:IS21 family transposase [Candidatus Dadabacteria bacterium]MXZ89788.1 IS21 family transposase [Dehalococcoidia bacterium]MYD29367.1 IS21 family transposase [Dehalococcoidia bacterium]
MLGVQDVYALRHKVFVEGKSERQAAREMGIARDTVRRYLATPLPEPQKRRRSRPVLERVRPRLEQLIEEWSERTTAKQRITGRRLHRALREEGYEVGLTLVFGYLREWRRERAEVYVPLVHRPGDEAQVDFFEVTVELSGERRKAWLFLMRLMYSGRDFVRLYERQDQLSFLDGHVRAFAHFGGAPRRAVYDNLKPAVRRLQFPRRQLTERFQALASHYGFEPCFARPGEGHDKGAWSRGAGASGSRS